MMDPGPTPEAAVPGSPQVPNEERGRADALADWVVKQRGSFTDAALERSALATGYTPEEFATAVEVADARAAKRAALAPIKSGARRVVLGAYAIVWALFAISLLLTSIDGAAPGTPVAVGFGPILQLILTVALGVGLAISLLVIRRGRPDPSRSSRAMVILMVVPVVLLLGVAGLCLPFVRA